MSEQPNAISREGDRSPEPSGDPIDALGDKSDLRSRVKNAVNDRVETVRGTIVEAAAGIRQTVAGASGALSSATEKVGDVVSDKLPSPDDVRDVARRGAGIAIENPFGLIFGALAAGFVLGLLVPVSDYERKTVGPIRDDLIERAKDAGTDAMSRCSNALLS